MDELRTGPPRLEPSVDGTYEVLFGYSGAWEQRIGLVVTATGPREAVAEAYRRAGWHGAPNNGSGGDSREPPVSARVRYHAVNPNAEAPSGLERCSRSTATVFHANGLVFERIPTFEVAGVDLSDPLSWVRR